MDSPACFSRLPSPAWLLASLVLLGSAPAAHCREEARDHWAWQSLQPPPLPTPRSAEGLRNEIDVFLQARLEAEGLTPAPPADRRTWLRRLSYDLTGLPPTSAEVEAFEANPAPDAPDHEVERLLASPHHGEHWGRRWLDVVRYADTAGENSDFPLLHIWRYRNWVFDAFNRDLPFDTFIRMQIAGDLIQAGANGPARGEGIVATGYLALARRFGHDSDKEMHLTREDAIDNLGQAFLGLSLACARCHDHKHDPVSQRDYYALYGIFASTRLSFAGCEARQRPRDPVPLLTPAEEEELKRPWRARREAADTLLRDAEAEAGRLRAEWQAFPSRRILASGEVGEGARVSLDEASSPELARVVLHPGEALLLSVSPRGNHGADSTRVDWTIRENGGRGRQWSTTDLLDSLLSANPHPGSPENPASWYFLELRDGPLILAERVDPAGKRAEVKLWRNGETPSVFVNTATAPVPVWTELAPRSFHVHPGPTSPVGVAWVGGLEGEVSVSIQVADAHPTPGDGVAFQLEHLASAQAGASLARIVELDAGARRTRQRRDSESGPEPQAPLAFAAAEGTPAHARIHLRGDPETPGDEVPRGWLQLLGGHPVADSSGSGRRELANWVAGSPLASRVFVNRVWQGHFGQGLVRTSNDFGTHGEAPSHPELLEWLAAWFEAHDRSPRALHRLILSSAAYRRSAQASDADLARDPDNRWLARFSPRRLTAEELRDTLLVVGGNLDRTPGEAHPFPPEHTWSFTQHAPFNAVYDNAKRTVYQMVQRQRRHPFLALFDGADPNASTGVRQLTTAPTQALFFLNDPFFHDQAARLAARLEAESDEAARIQAAHRQALQREPSPDEQRRALEFLATYPGSPAAKLGAYARVLLASNEFLHVD